jgi:hypothetical protein
LEPSTRGEFHVGNRPLVESQLAEWDV